MDLFQPVVADLLGRMGPSPRRFIEEWEPSRAGELLDLRYRWNTGEDVVHLVGALQQVLEEHEELGALAGPSAKESIEAIVHALSKAAADCSDGDFADLPRGFRSWMTRPGRGSACKRWAMYVRWMVRPTVEGVDLGLWSQPSAGLVVPVDVHVLRIARFTGLTRRKDASWKTAEDITANLRRIDAVDPVRFDFAIAHLGISGQCLGYRRSECSSCPLDAYCSATWKPKT